MSRGLAWWELLLALALLAIVIAILLPVAPGLRGSSGARAACQGNLKTMAVVFKMYAAESENGMYPPLHARTGPNLDCENGYVPSKSAGLIEPIPDLDLLYGEYISDVHVLVCPARDDFAALDRTGPDGRPEILQPCENALRGVHLAARNYEYLGWAFDHVECDTDITAGGLTGPRQLVEALEPLLRPWREGKATEADRARLLEHREVSKGIGNGPKPDEGTTVHRLQAEVERAKITDATASAAQGEPLSKVWIMWDRSQIDDNNNYIGIHPPGGSNVLFLDGHVEYMKFQSCGPAPVNRPFADFMREAFGP